MKNLLLLLLLLVPGLCFGQDESLRGTPDYLAEKNGFRDVQFAAPLSSYKGMRYVRPGKDNVKIYARPTDKLKIGVFPIKSLEYGFYKGELVSVFIKVEGKDNVDGVLTAFETNYGIPESSMRGLYRKWWSSRVYFIGTVFETKAEFEMSLRYLLDQVEKDATDAHIKRSERKEAAGIKAASDL